jgi:hypothetical protein
MCGLRLVLAISFSASAFALTPGIAQDSYNDAHMHHAEGVAARQGLT